MSEERTFQQEPTNALALNACPQSITFKECSPRNTMLNLNGFNRFTESKPTVEFLLKK